MLVLGIESSCDETAAAVVEAEDPAAGFEVRADIVSSQAALHETYGGVVPELASRHHLTNAIPVLEVALHQARVSLADLDGIAVTRGPGLVGALLVGVQLGKAIAYCHDLPLVGVNHLEGHLTSVFLRDSRLRADDPAAYPGFPHLALLVSGGHTELHAVANFGDTRLLGASRDDAAGEAFDKGAKMLGLGYPGGARIDALAARGDPTAIRFPRAFPGASLELSFSGLKTALGLWLKPRRPLPEPVLADVCASYQQAILDVLVDKACRARAMVGARDLVVAGGVAANRKLRSMFDEAARREGFRLFVPAVRRCTDNAAMIAAAGLVRLQRGERAGLDLNAEPCLSLEDTNPSASGPCPLTST